LKALIIGGFGYLGCRIGSYFSQKDFDITLLSRSSISYKKEFLNFEYSSLDFSWDQPHKNNFFKDYDVIVHSAGMNALDSKNNPNAAYNFKTSSNKIILDSIKDSHNVKYFYISSAHVYDEKCVGDFNEDSSTNNKHPYAKAIIAGEDVINESSNENKNYILRCANGFGAPIIDQEDCWNLYVNNICKQAFEDKIIYINHPFESRNFIPITQTCKIIEFIIHNNFQSQTFNVGSQKNMKLYEMASLVQEVCEEKLGFKPIIESDESIDIDAIYNFNISKISNYGFSYKEKFKSEIDNIFEYLARSNS